MVFVEDILVESILWQVRFLEVTVDERELEEEMGLEDRGIGHLFQGENLHVVQDTWQLIRVSL